MGTNSDALFPSAGRCATSERQEVKTGERSKKRVTGGRGGR